MRVDRATRLPFQGRYDEADALYARAIHIGQEVLGPKHAKLGAVLNNRALLLGKQVRI